MRLMENGGARLDGTDPARPLKPWLVTVALNLARRRLAGPKPVPLDRDPEAPGPVPEGDLAAALEGMESLSPRDRLVLDLAGIRGLPPERVAAALGVSPDSVRGLLSRARARLREKVSGKS